MCSGGSDSKVVEKAMVCARRFLPFSLQRFGLCFFVHCVYILCKAIEAFSSPFLINIADFFLGIMC